MSAKIRLQIIVKLYEKYRYCRFLENVLQKKNGSEKLKFAENIPKF